MSRNDNGISFTLDGGRCLSAFSPGTPLLSAVPSDCGSLSN
ncbi:MAG: hypothetical protein V8Q76_13010 [Bacteroides intestinalis]